MEFFISLYLYLCHITYEYTYYLLYILINIIKRIQKPAMIEKNIM